MAAPSYITASTGATDAGGAWTATGSAGTSGNVVILQILQDGSTAGAVTLDSATNIENLAGTDNAWTSIGSFAVGSPTVAYQRLWIGRLINTSAPTATGSNSTSEDLYWRFYEFSNVSTGTTLATVIENSTAGSTANTNATDGTITDAGVTTLGPDRLALQLIGISDDNALADFTGETGGDWTEAVAEYAESSGTDATIGLQIAYPAVLFYPLIAGAGSPIYGATGTNEMQAQSFASPGAETVTALQLFLTKNGSPGDNLTVEIQTDSGGVPSGTVVGTGATVAASTVVSGAWNRFSVSAALSASTNYWIVARRSGARDTGNYVSWWLASSSPYASQNSAARASGTWTTSANDMVFGVETSAGTINGGTTTNSDATDGWGVVGFALIGTTVAATYQPRYGFVHYNDPAIV